ncbi:unnamed protein product [Nezara viridula]|uniref:Uncharacterized protein n=1 Tax=Nezara viridula TaxID=85310 RepID=A0A9P0HAS0_NEZVI|nr:unnamed protein product [Nezara viridula]
MNLLLRDFDAAIIRFFSDRIGSNLQLFSIIIVSWERKGPLCLREVGGTAKLVQTPSDHDQLRAAFNFPLDITPSAALYRYRSPPSQPASAGTEAWDWLIGSSNGIAKPFTTALATDISHCYQLS